MNATIVDLRYRMKEVLRAIDSGETVTVLYRGKAKAALTPISTASLAKDQMRPRTADQPIFGMWKERSELAGPEAYVRNLRQPRPFPDQGDASTKRTPHKPK